MNSGFKMLSTEINPTKLQCRRQHMPPLVRVADKVKKAIFYAKGTGESFGKVSLGEADNAEAHYDRPGDGLN